jgi:sulfatase modifying factor 1
VRPRLRNCLATILLLVLAAGCVGVSQHAPPGMVFVPPGEFEMGDSYGEGEPHERPTHRVFVSGFFIGRTEVTTAQWREVFQWALTNGYRFDAATGQPAERGPNHPIGNLSWHDAAKWANALSEKTRRTPVYYTDATQQTVYRAGQLDLPNEAVRWSANGFRLPTEAEWEKAARGGRARQHFPWPSAGGSYTNHIDRGRASYWADDDVAGPVARFGPTPVGYFNGRQQPPGPDTANGYKLYDVAGNVAEWCWDWHDPTWYAQPAARVPDPRGPAAGFARVVRGGSWINHPKLCRVAYRYVSAPGYRCECHGLRLAGSAR